jgi:hypothetical protein
MAADSSTIKPAMAPSVLDSLLQEWRETLHQWAGDGRLA